MPKKIDRYILVVEDSSVDYEITIRSLRKVGVDYPVYRCEDGDEALRFLMKPNEKRTQMGYPSLILLDLNLPGTDGRDVLSQIKNTAETQTIPVVILTTSNNHNDIKACYESGSNCYVKKPTRPEEYTEMINAIKEFWFEWALLPMEEY